MTQHRLHVVEIDLAHLLRETGPRTYRCLAVSCRPKYNARGDIGPALFTSRRGNALLNKHTRARKQELREVENAIELALASTSTNARHPIETCPRFEPRVRCGLNGYLSAVRPST